MLYIYMYVYIYISRVLYIRGILSRHFNLGGKLFSAWADPISKATKFLYIWSKLHVGILPSINIALLGFSTLE